MGKSDHNIENQQSIGSVSIEINRCINKKDAWSEITCENTNFLIRDFFDGEDDFRKFDQRHMSKIARWLNERPRQTLKWKTPKQVFENVL